MKNSTLLLTSLFLVKIWAIFQMYNCLYFWAIFHISLGHFHILLVYIIFFCFGPLFIFFGHISCLPTVGIYSKHFPKLTTFWVFNYKKTNILFFVFMYFLTYFNRIVNITKKKNIFSF